MIEEKCMINKYYINIQMEETNNAGSKEIGRAHV